MNRLEQVEDLGEEASRGETTQGGGGGAKLEEIVQEKELMLTEHMGGTSTEVENDHLTTTTSLRQER